MIDTPRIEQRPARSYVGIRRTVGPDGFTAAFDECFPYLARWLDEHQVTPDGPAMVRYRSDDDSGYDIDMAFPVASAPGVDDPAVMIGVLPPGEYAVVTHVGPYEGVADAHGALDEWVTAQGRVQDDAAGARIEIYVTDPRAESDPTKFRVDVEQLLTDRHRPRR